MRYLLTVLILLPVAGALALVLYSFVAGKREEHSRWIALVVTLLTFAASLDDNFEVHETENREEALELIHDVGSFDVAVVDLRLRINGTAPTISGNETIRALRRAEPGIGIVAHGERPERHLATAAMQAGAIAYISRTASTRELRRAVDAALAQKSFLDPAVPPKGSRGKLTRRQREILQLLANGESTTAASRELGLSEETIKTHTKNVLARLEARNRTHAVAIALRESLVD
jgi:DNA-binding NarL/FixJ family response regulator